MDKVSVGVILFVMMVGIFVEGIIIIENVVYELEIVDIVIFLNVMGVKILGVGIGIIIIEGVECLIGCIYCIVVDCIEIGIFLIVVVVFGGKIICYGIKVDIFEVVIEKLCEVGMEVSVIEDIIMFDLKG